MDKKIILVVDDEPDIRSELGLFLEKQGYKVITAGNGKEAFDMYKKQKPDVVISDYRMPVMNGFDLLLNIKKINKSAYVILVSAVVDLDPFVMTKNRGVYEFMEKPLDLNKLTELIQRA